MQRAFENWELAGNFNQKRIKKMLLYKLKKSVLIEKTIQAF